MRGTFFGFSIEFDDLRFIPADAGNMGNSQAVVLVYTVHPRRCGEHTKIKLLNLQMFFNCKFFTDFTVESLFNYQRAMYYSSGKKETSLKPSISTGVRRFFPIV